MVAAKRKGNASKESARAEISGRWVAPSTGDSKRTARGGQSVTPHGRFLYIVGGRYLLKGEDLFCNDTLRVDTQGATCSLDLLCPNTATRNPFAPRAHHSATVVGEELWLIGGCDKSMTMHDVHVLDLATLTWKEVTDQIVGKPGLLQRVAHSAAVHPTEPQTILIYGGFTDYLSSRFLDSLVALDTASMRVKELNPHGIPPSPRAYHQMVMCANRCIILGGRENESAPVDGADMLAVYNATTNTWERPSVAGTQMTPRSNFAATLVPATRAPSRTPPALEEWAVLVHGGVVEERTRINDASALYLSKAPGDDGEITMRWCPVALPVLHAPATTTVGPRGGVRKQSAAELDLLVRAAHALVWCGGKLCMGFGFGGTGYRHYFDDMYVLKPVDCMVATLKRAMLIGAPGSTCTSPRGATPSAPAPEGTGWRMAKKARGVDDTTARPARPTAARGAEPSISRRPHKSLEADLSPSMPLLGRRSISAEDQIQRYKELYDAAKAEATEHKRTSAALEKELASKTAELATTEGMWRKKMETSIRDSALVKRAQEQAEACRDKEADLLEQYDALKQQLGQCKRDKVSAENEAARLQAELNRERAVASELQASSRRDADTLRSRLNDALAESRRLQDQINRDETESRRLEQRLEDERSTHDNSRRVLQRQLAQAEEGKAAAERQLEAVQADLRLARTKTDKLEADLKEKEVTAFGLENAARLAEQELATFKQEHTSLRQTHAALVARRTFHEQLMRETAEKLQAALLP